MRNKTRLIVIGWGLTVGWSSYISEAQVVWITAEAVDYRTSQPLSALWRWTDSSGHLLVKTLVPSSKFNGYVPVQDRIIHADVPGYRPVHLPLHWLNLPIDSLMCHLILKAVPIDKPIPDQPYFQSEQKDIQLPLKTATGGFTWAYIHTVDVLTNRPILAEVCLFFTREHRKTCYPAASERQLKLAQPDIIALEIRASGYQPYFGNLVVDKPSATTPVTYTVRLNPTPTSLVVMFSQKEPLRYVTVKALNARKTNQLTAFDSTLFFGDASPGTYQINMMPKVGMLKTDTIRLNGGINGYFFRGEIAQTHIDLPATCDVLYFAQSSYEINESARNQLDRLVVRMHNEPERTLRIVGHTDSAGNPQLNLTLSEFRAKVTRGYLIRKGIAPERIQIDAMGDRQPSSPNDTESNRSRNRRVDICLN